MMVCRIPWKIMKDQGQIVISVHLTNHDFWLPVVLRMIVTWAA